MAIPCSLDPLGSFKPYRKGTVLCNISAGATAYVTLLKGGGILYKSTGSWRRRRS